MEGDWKGGALEGEKQRGKEWLPKPGSYASTKCCDCALQTRSIGGEAVWAAGGRAMQHTHGGVGGGP